MFSQAALADTIGEKSQNHEELLVCQWADIEIDENMMAALRRVIEDIVKNTDNLSDQIIEAAKAVLKISESAGINHDAIMISVIRIPTNLSSGLILWSYMRAKRGKKGQKAKSKKAKKTRCNFWKSSYYNHCLKKKRPKKTKRPKD